MESNDGTPAGTESGPPESTPPTPEPADFVALRKRAQAAEAEVKALRDAQAKREADTLAEQGRYKELHETATAKLTQTESRLAELEARETARLERVAERNAVALASLDDSQRAAVDRLTGDSASADQVAAVIETIRGLAPAASATPVVPAGGRSGTDGTNPDTLTSEERAVIEALIAGGNKGLAFASPSAQRRVAQARIGKS